MHALIRQAEETEGRREGAGIRVRKARRQGGGAGGRGEGAGKRVREARRQVEKQEGEEKELEKESEKPEGMWKSMRERRRS